jgi:putative endonuclease
MSAMYYVYILECTDGTLYTGITTDVARRFEEHKSGKGAHYTRSHKPVRIVHSEEHGTRSAAQKREAEIKKWSRVKKIRYIGLSTQKW